MLRLGWNRLHQVPAVVLALLAAACSSSEGVRQAPVPEDPWAVPVSSVKLREGVPPEVRDACRELRGEVQVPIVCPRRYPGSGFVETGSPSDDKSLRTPNVYSPEIYELTFNNGTTRGYLHWVMGVARPQAFELHVMSGTGNVTPGPPRPLGVKRVEGRTVRLYEYDGGRGGPNSGHVLAVIDTKRLVVYGSVHGVQHRDYAIALAIDAAAQIDRAATTTD